MTLFLDLLLQPSLRRIQVEPDGRVGNAQDLSHCVDRKSADATELDDLGPDAGRVGRACRALR